MIILDKKEIYVFLFLNSFTIFVTAFSIGILSILYAPTKPTQEVLEYIFSVSLGSAISPP